MENFNELDKAFKKALTSLEQPPPVAVFGGVKVAILEKKVASISSQNMLLKGVSGVLLLLLGASTWLLLQKDNRQQQGNIELVKTKIDTVYVTNTVIQHDTIYLESTKQQIVYVNQASASTLEKTPPAIIENTDNKLVEKQENVQNKQAENQNIAPENQNIVLGKQAKEEVVNNLVLENNTNQKEKQVDNQLIERKKIDLLNLSNKSYLVINRTKNLPTIRYDMFSRIRSLTQREEKITLAERIFFEASTGESANQFVVKNATTQGSYKEGNLLEANVGLKFKNGWSVKTGLAYDNTLLVLSTGDQQVLFAENYLGTPSFIYRTPFGNALIPNSKLGFEPSIQDKIVVKTDDENQMSFWRIPIQMQYDILDKSLKILGGYRDTKLYFVGGGYLSLPYKKNIQIEVNGDEDHIMLTDFKGVSNISFGASLGFGGKVFLNHKIALFSEASYYRNFTYLVNNEYYQSYPRGAKINFGLHYQLK